MAPLVALGISLAKKYGPEVGEKFYNIYKTWADKKEITPEMWAEARAVNALPLEFYEGQPAYTPDGQGGMMKVMAPTPIPQMPWTDSTK